MHPGAGAEVPGRAPAKVAERADRQPQIEEMCADLVELRSHASRLEDQARHVEIRLLGPIPAGEGPPDIAKVNVPCLTGIIGHEIRTARESLRGVGYALDRIMQEFGSIGSQE